VPSTQATLFEMGIHRIRREADVVVNLATSVASCRVQAEVCDLFDLKRSAANLRQAADHLDDIRRKLEEPSS
jgi:exosome complex RNA-binding protein Csl4